MTTVKHAGRALVVDDDADQARFMAEVLLKASLEPELVSGAEEALERLQRMEPTLIVLDIQLAKRSGMSLYREIRQSNMSVAKTPVIFVSGFSMAQDFEGPRFSRLMGDDRIPPPQAFVPKPVDPDRLLAAVRTALEGAAPDAG